MCYEDVKKNTEVVEREGKDCRMLKRGVLQNGMTVRGDSSYVKRFDIK